MMNAMCGTNSNPMPTRGISEAKDPVLRASLAALQRAALLARQTAIETGTNLVIVKDGRLLRLSVGELRQQAQKTDAPKP
jgi:hypothetical protein